MNSYLTALFKILIGVTITLLGLHLGLAIWAGFSKTDLPIIASTFHLDMESNIPTWYSTILLLSVSLTAFFIYFLEKKNQTEKKTWSNFWLYFSAVYCFLSFDETARVHELIDKIISVKWIYFYAPFAAVFFICCLIYFVIINSQNTELRNSVIGGLIVFAAGGLGFEAIDHIFRPLPIIIQNLEYIIEEGLEMIGTIIILMGCLTELVGVYENVNAKINFNEENVADAIETN